MGSSPPTSHGSPQLSSLSAMSPRQAIRALMRMALWGRWALHLRPHIYLPHLSPGSQAARSCVQGISQTDCSSSHADGGLADSFHSNGHLEQQQGEGSMWPPFWGRTALWLRQASVKGLPNADRVSSSGYSFLPSLSPSCPLRLPSVFAQRPPQGHLPCTRQHCACSCPHPNSQGQQPQGKGSCAPALLSLPPGTTLILCGLGMRPGSRSKTQPWTGPQRGQTPLWPWSVIVLDDSMIHFNYFLRFHEPLFTTTWGLTQQEPKEEHAASIPETKVNEKCVKSNVLTNRGRNCVYVVFFRSNQLVNVDHSTIKNSGLQKISDFL